MKRLRRWLGLPICTGCRRTIWWWHLPTHRRSIEPWHFDEWLVYRNSPQRMAQVDREVNERLREWNRRGLILAALLALASPAGAQELHGLGAASDVHPCDGQLRNVAQWVNQTGQPVRLFSVTTWIGTTDPRASAPVDVWTTVWGPNGLLLDALALDHYVPFEGLHQKTLQIPPPLTITLAPGEGLLLQHGCQAYGGEARSQTQILGLYY